MDNKRILPDSSYKDTFDFSFCSLPTLPEKLVEIELDQRLHR